LPKFILKLVHFAFIEHLISEPLCKVCLQFRALNKFDGIAVICFSKSVFRFILKTIHMNLNKMHLEKFEQIQFTNHFTIFVIKQLVYT